MRSSRSTVAVGGLLLLAGAGCYPQHRPAPAPRPHPPSASAAAAPPSALPAACPTTYAAPDPQRPVIRLTFDLSGDRRVVTGTESVRFTPDRPVTELVFRLWPNSRTAPAGTRLAVTRAVTPGGGAYTTQSLGARAGTPGTLLSIPLGHTAPAGRPMSADLAFTLALPKPAFERWGSSGVTAWWASGHPLLAWVRGNGWAREPAVQFPAEATTSEAAATDVTVTAPAGDEVLMTGLTDPPRALPGGRQSWHSTSAAARDVSVAVGRFTTRTAVVDGVRVTAGVASDIRGDPVSRHPVTAEALFGQVRRSLPTLAGLYGPFPYPSLAVAALPSLSSGGIEYPGAIQVGNDNWQVVVPHETAHQYFYGLVGDDQARDPWLDEAFATYSEALVNGSQKVYLRNLDLPGRVGASTQSWGTDAQAYYRTIYAKGAAALLSARDRAGPAAFDGAIRCYVRANAWTVATPAAVARALAGLPAAIAVLSKAGALP